MCCWRHGNTIQGKTVLCEDYSKSVCTHTQPENKKLYDNTNCYSMHHLKLCKQSQGLSRSVDATLSAGTTWWAVVQIFNIEVSTFCLGDRTHDQDDGAMQLRLEWCIYNEARMFTYVHLYTIFTLYMLHNARSALCPTLLMLVLLGHFRDVTSLL